MINELIELIHINGLILYILNVILLMTLTWYCYLKIRHYNIILKSKKSELSNFVKFLVFGFSVYVSCFLVDYGSFGFIVVIFALIFLYRHLYIIKFQLSALLANDFLIILIICDSIGQVIIEVLFNRNIMQYTLELNIVRIIFVLILTILTLYIFNIKSIGVSDWNRFIYFRKNTTGLISFQIIIIFFYYISYLKYQGIDSLYMNAYHLALTISLIISYRIVLYNVITTSYNYYDDIQYKVITEQMKVLMVNYNAQSKQIVEVKKFKHDFNNLLNIMNRLVENEKYDELNQILRQTNNLGEKYFDTYREFSNNVIIQSIIYDTYIYSLEKNIKFEAIVNYSDKIKMEDLEICRLFTNVFGNCIEACIKIDENIRYIKVESNINEKWNTIVFKNSYDGNVKMINNSLVTTKENQYEHGYGTRYVNETIEKYDGIIEYVWDDNEFITSIHLPIID